MLIVSLIVSAVLLLLVNLAAYKAKQPLLYTFAAGFAFSFLPCCMMAMLTTPMIQAFGLFMTQAVCVLKGYGPRVFMFASFIVTAGSYGITGTLAVIDSRRHESLRDEFPFESMADRVPEPRRHPDNDKLSQASEGRLADLEERLHDSPWESRTWALRRLHEGRVDLFINSPGFGAARMIRLTEAGLRRGTEADYVSAAPATGPKLQPSPSDGQATDNGTYSEMHRGATLNFADPKLFGLVKSREQVAGFLAHGFRSPRVGRGDWEVHRLELVGLLLHDEPVAYVSEHLPRMDKVRETPTRQLDAFEELGLSVLRRGEDLFVGETSEGMRMLGALRAAKQCVECHGGERGDLLGAFSYTLRPKEKVTTERPVGRK